VIRSQLAAHVRLIICSSAFHPEVRIWTCGARIVHFSCPGHNEFATEPAFTEITADAARRPVASETGPNFRLVVPAQPVDAIPSSALIRQRFLGRTISLAVRGQNLSRTTFQLV